VTFQIRRLEVPLTNPFLSLSQSRILKKTYATALCASATAKMRGRAKLLARGW
jgi:hypothetical protein